MATLFDAQVVLFQKISLLTGVNLNKENATLFNVRSYEGEGSKRNTSVDFKQNDSDTVFTVNYDRMNVADLDFTSELDKTHLVLGESTHEMLEELFKWTNFHFTADDLEDLPVIDNEDGTYTIRLVCKPGSYLWMGETEVVFRDMPVIEGNLFISHTGGYI